MLFSDISSHEQEERFRLPDNTLQYCVTTSSCYKEIAVRIRNTT